MYPTDVRQHHRLMPPPYGGGGITTIRDHVVDSWGSSGVRFQWFRQRKEMITIEVQSSAAVDDDIMFRDDYDDDDYEDVIIIIISLLKKPHVRRTCLHNKNITNLTHK